ncbi:MAG: 1-deoxy-D-xylulose 5-phosphate reductoisomerase [Chitinophagaceae bacterium]|nr:1-deoxy-D-xylulose 5-phosphate reductoisomerase [Chitinophagaceae bacterium]
MRQGQQRNIAILGSTGSIGTQALDVVRKNPELFGIEILTAQYNDELLVAQAIEFRPNAVVIVDESKYKKVFDALNPLDIKVYTGASALNSVVQMESIDMVLTALVGYAGLIPTIKAIEAGKHIALANKETLVVAGQLITDLCRQYKVDLLPVDSEHSAIFQCLAGEWHNPIEKIILTASGGPFRGKLRSDLMHVGPKEALKHPNWSMGSKITIDSASLMNKGLEVIEAKWLFDVNIDQIEVVVHPQSIIHSLVQFTDGSIKAQMGLPDMKLPIQYALAYPNRIPSDFPRFDFSQYGSLTFEKPDLETFRNLGLAFEAMQKGGNTPCVLNSANEVAVEQFLKEKIGFMEMSEIIEACMAKVPYIAKPVLDDYISSDEEARRIAKELVGIS